MSTHFLIPLFLACGLFAWSPSLLGQGNSFDYSIPWYTADGGGAESSGGVYSLRGTIGQTDAHEAMSGGDFTLTGGFWGAFEMLPLAELPSLSATRDQAGTVVTVSWPSSAVGFFLQETESLQGSSTVWTRVNPPYNTNAGRVSVAVPPSAARRFYRLERP